MLKIQASTFAEVRYSLALSLALQKECAISIDSTLKQHVHYSRTITSMVDVLQKLSIPVVFDNTTITIQPKPPEAFTAHITLHPFCPVSDIFLIIAPVCIRNPIQSDIVVQGVTHCQYAHSSSFLRFGLASLLMHCGCYLHAATKKFGFYTGTGTVTAKVYPYIKKEWWPTVTATRISNIRIYIANIDQEFAFYQKKYLCETLSLNQDKCSIMQIANVTNHGNAVDVFFTTGNISTMLSFTMPLYDDTGNFVFHEAMMQEFLQCIISTCMESYEYVPLPIVEEALPFLVSAGYHYSDSEKFNPKIKHSKVYALCMEFIN